MIPELLSQVKANCEEAEGRIPHFYLDTCGNVTIAIGHLVSSSLHATALKLYPSDMILDDFTAVSQAKPGMVASAYAPLCNTRMSDPDIDALLEADLNICYNTLDGRMSIMPFPNPAQAAFLDMAFNLGVGGLITKFPKLCSAASLGDWTVCAKECQRRGISPTRNAWTASMFAAAGNIKA